MNIFLNLLSWGEEEGVAMSLTNEDTALVKGFWAKIASKADDIGAEALGR